MEDTLGVMDYDPPQDRLRVLILVLMEDTLGVDMDYSQIEYRICLNPCSNERYSRSLRCLIGMYQNSTVLILVLMEDTLGE